MSGLVRERRAQGREVRVLNLFAYTGGATMACAMAGAQVCHCDAAKGMMQWARENRELCRVPEDRTRWILDDALKFVSREARRGLSTVERKMLRSAKQILLSEVMLVEDLSYDGAEQLLSRSVLAE